MDDEERPYEIESISSHIFTGGLDFDQEVTLNNLNEALHRGERYLDALAHEDAQMMHMWEPLHRLLMGISLGALLPIARRIQNGEEPHKVLAGVVGGIGGMFFFGGVEYAKMQGLDGVGMEVPPEKTNGDDSGNFYPEEKPGGPANQLANGGLDALLASFKSQNPDIEDD